LKRAASRVVLFFLFLSLAGLAGLGYSHVMLRQERNALDSERRELERKVALLEMRYSEKRALESQLTRTKLGLEGRLRALQGEVEEAQKKRDVCKNAAGGLAGELSKSRDRASLLEKSLKDLTEQHQGLQEEIAETRKAHERALKEHEREMEKLGAEKKAVESELTASLRSAQQRIERYEGHNARLLLIAKELVEAYKNKGVSTSVLQVEPFTQIRRVEMEHLEQEYLDRIEREKIRIGDGAR
jgi:chromosome segregation ATPase